MTIRAVQHATPPEPRDSIDGGKVVTDADRQQNPMRTELGSIGEEDRKSVGGQVNGDAAWYYPDPKPAAANIKDHVAFWRGVTVER